MEDVLNLVSNWYIARNNNSQISGLHETKRNGVICTHNMKQVYQEPYQNFKLNF